MRLGTAIERLVEAYNYACDKEWIQDKVAWALYHTWKEADRKTEPQTENDFTLTYTCSFSDCENFKHFGFGEKCIECKRKQSEVKHKDEPQTDCAWK